MNLPCSWAKNLIVQPFPTLQLAAGEKMEL